VKHIDIMIPMKVLSEEWWEDVACMY